MDCKFFYKFTTRRRCLAPIGEPVRQPKEIVSFLRKAIFNDPSQMWREWSVALFFDNGKRIIGYEVLAMGGTDRCGIDIKPVCRTAIQVMAAGVVHVHNHPNGSCEPSCYDIESIATLRKALSTLDIELIDAIVITEKDAFSFALDSTV